MTGPMIDAENYEPFGSTVRTRITAEPGRVSIEVAVTHDETGEAVWVGGGTKRLDALQAAIDTALAMERMVRP